VKKLLFPSLFIKGAVEHVFDNYVRDTISEPAVGSIVYCDLAFGTSEHSGVYLGQGEIMQLNSQGKIERVSPEKFVSNMSALSIYVSCKADEPVGCPEVAERAKFFQKILLERDYNVLLDNCHQFAAGCLTGDPDNPNNFLWMLKHECEKRLSADSWRVWERPWLVDNSNNDEKAIDADELSRLIDRKMKQFRELNDLSETLAFEVFESIDRCPFDGPFLAKRTASWEKKNALLDRRLQGVSLAISELENEIIQLEKQLEELEKRN